MISQQLEATQPHEISGKPLSQAPRRLQSLLIRLFRYDIEFQYVKVEQLYLADTLSRAYLHTDVLAELQDNSTRNDMHVMVTESVKIPDQRLIEIRDATNGWPESKQDVPDAVKPYFDVRDTLSKDNGIITKGERVVVPKVLRKDIKNRRHVAHLGYDSMMRRARETIYWPGISRDVKQILHTSMGKHC